MSTAHTPGPWKAVHDFDGDYGIFGDNQGGPLATTYTDSPEDEANARLIAAAPEMLEVLECVNRMWVEAEYTWDLGGKPTATRQRILDVIRKAKGDE